MIFRSLNKQLMALDNNLMALILSYIIHFFINQSMINGSWLQAGWVGGMYKLRVGGVGKGGWVGGWPRTNLAVGPPGPGPSAKFSWPWAMSLEAWAMSHEPWTIRNRPINRFFNSKVSKFQTFEFQKFKLPPNGTHVCQVTISKILIFPKTLSVEKYVGFSLIL